MSNVFEIDDEIVEIEYIGEQDTIDINTTGNKLFYANGILTHNSAVEEIEFDHSHISGGISKINTADNVFGIYTSHAMKAKGLYQLQLMKTRSSSGVGQKIDLEFDINTLRIVDPQNDNDDDSAVSSPTSAEIMGNLKASSSINPTGVVEAEKNGAKVTANVESAKLNQFLTKQQATK